MARVGVVMMESKCRQPHLNNNKVNFFKRQRKVFVSLGTKSVHGNTGIKMQVQVGTQTTGGTNERVRGQKKSQWVPGKPAKGGLLGLKLASPIAGSRCRGKSGSPITVLPTSPRWGNFERHLERLRNLERKSKVSVEELGRKGGAWGEVGPGRIYLPGLPG